MSRGLVGLAFVLALFIGARSSAAQEVGANCRVLAPHVENPFDYSHYYTQPALAWDLERAALSTSVFLAVAHWTPLPPMWAAAIPSVGFGLLPHLVGYSQGRYGVSMHWAFTLSVSSLPLVFVARDHRAAAVSWLASTASLVCWDR